MDINFNCASNSLKLNPQEGRNWNICISLKFNFLSWSNFFHYYYYKFYSQILTQTHIYIKVLQLNFNCQMFEIIIIINGKL